jgi:hypothetical protein
MGFQLHSKQNSSCNDKIKIFYLLCHSAVYPKLGLLWSFCSQITAYTNFTFMWPCIVTNFFIIKPTRCTNSQLYFGLKLCMFRTILLSIIRSLFTVHSAMVYVIQVCRQLSSRTRMELQFHLGLLESCLQTCMTYTSADFTENKLLMMSRETVRNM